MKHIKKFEVASERMFEPPKKHEPKHRYDCEKCKYNWCCGYNCACKLTEFPKKDSPVEKYNL